MYKTSRMAPGPHNLEGNRFASLAVSPRAKKKRTFEKVEDHFPTLQTIKKKENPRYVVMATNNEKKLTDFSCFAVHKSIKIISNEIISISEMRDGNLLLLVKDNITAEKFIKTKQLHGLCPITCTLHKSLNYVKGTIYAPCLKNVSNEEIVKELKEEGVVDVYKFNKQIEGKSLPSGVMLITFDRYRVPESISVSWHMVKVKEYYPNPMRCKNCQKLGHTAKRCTNAPTCERCNLPPHAPSECTRLLCANCLEEHSASAKSCPKYIQQKEFLKIQCINKCSLKEARRIFNAQNTIPQLNLQQQTFAATAANNEKSRIITTSTTANNKTASPSIDTTTEITDLSKTKTDDKKKQQQTPAISSAGTYLNHTTQKNNTNLNTSNNKNTLQKTNVNINPSPNQQQNQSTTNTFYKLSNTNNINTNFNTQITDLTNRCTDQQQHQNISCTESKNKSDCFQKPIDSDDIPTTSTMNNSTATKSNTVIKKRGRPRKQNNLQNVNNDSETADDCTMESDA